MDVKKNILKLKKQLYPKGRAFNYNETSVLQAFHRGLAEPLKQAYNNAKSILDSLLADNPNFTTVDATQWERRLAITSNPNTDLSDRKKAIIRKLQHPGQVAARQHRLFIENQLRLAGFDVRVYENRFYDNQNNLTTLTAEAVGGVQHGEFQHGEVEHGDFQSTIIANYIDEQRDENFNVGNNFRSTFFVASNDLGTIDSLGVTILNQSASTSDRIANIPVSRKNEFRELILKLKPTQTVGYLLVNYI